jgi:hypothetical protein
MGSTFGFQFVISNFFILICPGTCNIKGQLSDEELQSIPSRLCDFLLHEYILPCGRFYIPDGHMAQFPVLCDYILQG